jgi:tRNA A-37 threonylcarbamoyl transferase component Bud32
MLADRYRLDAPIEAGATGEVWSARDTVLNRPVAVKLITEAHAADEAVVSRFRAESRHAAALSHSGVAQVFDYGEQQGTSLPCPYLVMEHVSGQPLSKLIAQAGVLPADVVLDITAQAARALQAAHDIGITHRHVKPSNLLVTDDGRVKVTDFGTAAVTPGSQVATAADAELASAAAYMSPEQAGGTPATRASDIYSLGVVAYECAAGRLPFSGETARALAVARAEGEPRPLPEAIPAPVRELIMRMIAKDPWMRPGSALAVAETATALRKVLRSAASPGRARPPGPAAIGTGARRPGRAGPTGMGNGARRPGRGGPAAMGTGAGRAIPAGPDEQRIGHGLAGLTGPVAVRPGTNPVRPEAGAVRPGTNQVRPGTNQVRPGTNPVAVRTGTDPARPSGDAMPTRPVRPAGRDAMQSGTDAATTTAPQPWVQGAQRGTSRRRRAWAVAAAAVAVAAVGGTLAAMLHGGNGGNHTPVAGQAQSPGPAVQAVLPALRPTAHPSNRASRKPRKTNAGTSKTGRPRGAGGAAAPAPVSQPASAPPAPKPGPSQDPPPSAPPPGPSPPPTSPPTTSPPPPSP